MTQPLAVLIVDDSAEDAARMRRALQRGGFAPTCERVYTAEALRATLTQRTWDIVLYDHTMPNLVFGEAFGLVQRLCPDVPFLIVSDAIGEEVAIAAMRSGAQDYVLKSDLGELPRAVRRALEGASSRIEKQRSREQLIVADRMASLGRMAAGMAHEVNNPLSVVIGNLDLALAALERVALPAAITAQLRDAADAAHRIRGIVRDLKLLSRADEERTEAVDVEAVIEAAIRMAANELRHRACVTRALGDVPCVEANEGRLTQVFVNLLLNAAQAIDPGDAEHNEVHIATGLSDAGEVVVAIRDTGGGIPAEALPRIFDAFYTTKPVGVGTGLGLSISRHIVADLGGRIEVESAAGAGSTFRVVLRAAQAPLVEAAPAAPAAAPRRGRVLVIDDEPMVGRVIVRTLEDEHEVVVATLAREALERIVAGERFDLILCDLMMPQMTGMELFAQLAPEQRAHVVFLTGGAFSEQERAFLASVDNAKVDKPFSIGSLRSLVNERIR